VTQRGDRRAGAIGFAIALVLLVGFVGYWTDDVALVALIAVGVVLLGAMAWWLWDRPERAPRLEDLPPEERARRREAGRILREVVPPVSEEEARRLLAPPWARGPDDWPQRPPAPDGPESGS